MRQAIKGIRYPHSDSLLINCQKKIKTIAMMRNDIETKLETSEIPCRLIVKKFPAGILYRKSN